MDEEIIELSKNSLIITLCLRHSKRMGLNERETLIMMVKKLAEKEKYLSGVLNDVLLKVAPEIKITKD